MAVRILCKSRTRFISGSILILVTFGVLWFLSAEPLRTQPIPQSWKGDAHHPGVTPSRHDHPIDYLIKQSKLEFEDLIREQSHDINSAAKAYRSRRGRHPPPGFDAWFAFAQSHDGLIIESFFDQIHHDIRPFWGIEPKDLRHFAAAFGHVVSVHNGTATWRSDQDRPWMSQWHDMVQRIAQYLPDMDLAINVMDESRVIAPWETINKYLQIEENNRKLIPHSEAIASYSNLSIQEGNFQVDWHSQKLWTFAREACHPDSAARGVPVLTNFSNPIPSFLNYTSHLYEGYVSNWTQSKDPCFQPDLQTLHGSFIEPISMSTTTQLIPIFGGSKLPMNNELLLPSAMYWKDFSEGAVYSAGDSMAWEKKQEKMVWRGIASGGRNRNDTWHHFQRHRFLSMVNGTSVHLAESGDILPDFHLPPQKLYPIQPIIDGTLGGWISSFSDAAFSDLVCFPGEGNRECSYTNNYFSLGSWMNFNDMFNFKYLPDIDGNSFSGRYLSFLRSSSLPIKATIYNEWHDSRLVAWQHFVPMDNSFVDVYGIMEYFLGYGTGPGNDEAARQIATQGREWAEKVLREEDMLVYTYRLLLEYARICDDQREKLAYIPNDFL